jgi:hypothetical protein
MYGIHYCSGLIGAGNGQYFRVVVEDFVTVPSQAAGNDYVTILLHRLTYGVERLFDCGINKTTGINNYQISGSITVDQRVPFGTQLAEDALRVNCGLGATEADKADILGCRHGWIIRVCFRMLKNEK